VTEGALLEVAGITKWYSEQRALANAGPAVVWSWKQARFRGDVFQVLPLLFAFTGAIIGAAAGASAQSNDAALRIETKIPLGDVRGRIDHMAADIERQRLFVAELGNNTVGIVDVGQGKMLQVLGGLKEPQGVGYLPSADTLFVANGGDGSLRLFQGPNYTANARIDFGSDADNVRVDQSSQHVVVGYGNGALAVIDGATRNKIAEIRLPAHPEGFQLDPSYGPGLCQPPQRPRHRGR